MHQNKDLHNFRKQGQRSILELNKGLEYTLNDQTYFKNSETFKVGLAIFH